METAAEEKPLRLATSRIVAVVGCGRFLEDAGSRDFGADDAALVAFDSGDAMDSLNCRLLLADTTGRWIKCQARAFG